MPSLLSTNDPFALRLLMTEELYRVDEPEVTTIPAAVIPAEEPVEAPAPSFNFTGENNRFFLVLVHQPAHVYASNETLDTLARILKGMQLELRDIALLNLAHHTVAGFDQLKSFFACSKMAVFGIDPAKAGLPSIPGNEITVHEGVRVLVTYGFEEMSSDEQKKRVFWNEMKKL